MKSLNALVIVTLLTISGFSQDEPQNPPVLKNSVYMEFYGNSGHSISFNYERLNFNGTNIGIRLGFGILPPSLNYKSSASYGSIPFEINYLLGSNNHYIEFGLGSSYLFEYGPKPKPNSVHLERWYMDTFAFFSRVGYRYISDKGLVVRVGFTPATDIDRAYFENRIPFNLWGGVSIGYSF